MVELITKRQKYLITLWMFKYYPVLGTFLMWLYVGLLIFDNHLIFEHNVASDSFIGMLCILFLMINFVLIFVSDVLRFCWLHRAMFVYMGIVGSCISYEYFIGFGRLLLMSRVVVFFLGTILLVHIIYHWRGYISRNNIRRVCHDTAN